MKTLDLFVPTDPPLGATLMVPDHAIAAALVHQGGGVHDRDGNMPAVGFQSSLYRRLATLLGDKGIATLRFDKRGSDKPALYPHTYTLPQRVDDARAALGLLRGHKLTARLPTFLVGHSEGGMVVTKLAETESVAGVVALCAPFGNIFELGRIRARRLVDEATGAQKAKGERALEYYSRLEQFFKEGTKLPPEQFVEFARPYLDAGYNGWDSFEWLAGHWAEYLKADPPKHGRPMLVVQGGRDARLHPDNARHWREWCDTRPLAEFHLIAHLGHDLNDARQKLFRVDNELIELASGWIERMSVSK
ncbi:MAG: alpha/beta fold hydrolase [Planctomycetes bacterium]|nr:alpha/beta fold hydrolase [Planctomycetota bacterium]